MLQTDEPQTTLVLILLAALATLVLQAVRAAQAGQTQGFILVEISL